MNKCQPDVVALYADLANPGADGSAAFGVEVAHPARMHDFGGVRRNRSDDVSDLKNDVAQLGKDVLKAFFNIVSG